MPAAGGYEHRAELDPENEEENSWRTFRNVPTPERHCSFFREQVSTVKKKMDAERDVNNESILKPQR